MEPEARYTAVGAALLALIVLLAVSLVWLGRSGSRRDARSYQIDFSRQSLGGLRARSDVFMRGIQVGEVVSVRFSPRRPGVIEVMIALDPETPVRQSTRAVVDRNLITGGASLDLRTQSEDSPLLDGERPVIAEGDSPMEDVSATLNQVARRADAVVERINGAFTPANLNALAEILENLRRASGHANATLAKADRAIESIAADVHEADGSVVQVGEAARRIADDTGRLSKRLETAITAGDGEMRASVRALRAAAESVDVAAAHLSDPREVIYGPADGSLGPGEEAK